MKAISLEEMKTIEINILIEIANFCEKNDICYYLAGGTLLGAVRHKGFIPWDDDVDIMLPRPDYERFIKSFNEESGENYEIVSLESDKLYPFIYAVVNDKRTIKIEKNLRKKYTDSLAVNVDVFPIDGLPNNKNEIDNYYAGVRRYGFLLQCATYSFGKGSSFLMTVMKNSGIAVYRVLELLHIISLTKVRMAYVKYATRYNYCNSNTIGITTISHYGFKEANRKISYEISRAIFEENEYNIPKGYDTYLKQLYGDYMKIPPKEMQATHHVSSCYWK